MKFEDVFKEWFEDKKQYVKRSTLSAYTLMCVNHLIPTFGQCEYISEKSVQELVLKKIEGGLSHKSVKDVLIVLKMILRYGFKNDLIKYDDLSDISYPTVHTVSEIDVLSVQDYKKIVNHIKENFTFRNLGILIVITTGIRIGEVCALTWDDIDVNEGTLKISKTIQRIYMRNTESVGAHTELLIDTPKTKNSIRTIPLNPDVMKIIKSIHKVTNKDFYVLTNEVKPTEPRTYRNYFKDFMKSLNLPDIKFHGLRHTFATQCINAKIDVKTVSVLLGHSNVSTTFNLYVHPDMEQKKSAINQLYKKMK